MSVLPGRVVAVTGHLGCFRASAAGPQSPWGRHRPPTPALLQCPIHLAPEYVRLFGGIREGRGESLDSAQTLSA